MFKSTASGSWEHDFRVKGCPRFHASYGALKKADAQRLHNVAVALFRAKALPVIEAWRAGRVTIEELTELYESGKPFSAAMDTAHQPWPTLRDAVDQYCEWLTANDNKATGTAETARSQLNMAVEHFGAERRLDTITSAQGTAYQQWLKDAGYATNTITAYVWRVGTMYRWFIRREATAAREEKRTPRVLYVPLDAEEISNKKTRRTRILTFPEAARLLEVAPRRFLAPVMCGLLAGLRVDEMLHLRPAFDVGTDLLTIQEQSDWKPKTKRSLRSVPIAAALRTALDAHLKAFASDAWLVPAFRDPSRPMHPNAFDHHFGQMVTNAKLVRGRGDADGVTFHTLRHTFASWLLMKNSDLFTVAQLLGNTVKQVEDTYGHLSKDHRAAAVSRLSGLVTMPGVGA